MVIGLTGAGKSSIIKLLTDRDVHIEHSINSGISLLSGVVLKPANAPTFLGTSKFEMFPTIIDGQRYILIDTPGFDDEERDDVEIFQEILNWFTTMTPYCDLAGILYVHDITHRRFNGSAKLNLEMLQALCGEQFYKNITIITTMWGENMHSTATQNAEKRQQEFKEKKWKKLIDGGTRVVEHRHGFEESKSTPPPDALPSTAHEVENSEPQCQNAEEQREIVEKKCREAEEKREKAQNELCDMMEHYINSEIVRPTIQDELRRKVKILDTEAGKVLRKRFNLPATTDQVDDDSSSIPESPATTEQPDNGDSSTPSPPNCPLRQIDGNTSSIPRSLSPLRAISGGIGGESSSNPHSPSSLQPTTEQIGSENIQATTQQVCFDHSSIPSSPAHEPAAREQISDDGSSFLSSPSCWTADDELLLQSQHSQSSETTIHVVHHHHHHCRTPSSEREEKKEGKKEKKKEKNEEMKEEKENLIKRIIQAIKWFFGW